MLTGNFSYNRTDRQTEFNLTGAALPLESIKRIQTARLPIGGQLNFQFTGPARCSRRKCKARCAWSICAWAPTSIGSFQGQIDSDGRRMALQLDSAMATGALHGTWSSPSAATIPSPDS